MEKALCVVIGWKTTKVNGILIQQNMQQNCRRDQKRLLIHTRQPNSIKNPKKS